MGHIGRYEIIEQIGVGAMGIVYRAHDAALDRAVALKTIRTGVDVDPEIRQRFYREARACARLQHPNIVTVFDLGEVENTAYIAMESLEGADFRQIIKEHRSMSVETKIAAAVEVCDAIAHAHRHGVIHRDIKPSNLFLTNGGRTKVLDFGIARLPSSRLTVAGQILGTPNYMAPEQILAQPSDGRADLFSAAVVFFELFTDVHPFQSAFIPRRIVQSEPDSLFDSNSSLPVILEKIFARGLAKDPNQRYQTGGEFAADLRAVLDAVRGNSSPSFSGVQLPSQHAVPVAQFPPESASAVAVPDGQDPQEWRLSEALRLLPEFEAAIERQDLAGAQAIIIDFESRLAGDVRFIEAIKLCRFRLKAASSENGLAVTDGPDKIPFARASVKPPRRPRPRLSSVPDQGNFPAESAPPAAREVQPPSSLWRTAISLGPVPGKTLGIAAAVVVCAALVLTGGIAAFQPIPVGATAATAIVGTASVNIYAGPGSSMGKIASTPRGAELNVLVLPASRDQEWIKVQLIKPRVYRPGYVRIRELSDWNGRTGEASLILIRTLNPEEPESEEGINALIQQFDSLAARFAGEPAAQEARLDAARLRLSLAHRQKADGNPFEGWQSELKTARQELELLAGDQRLRVRALDLTRQIDELLAGQPAIMADPPQEVIPARQPAPDISTLLARAKQLRIDGDYAEEERVIERILRVNPSNKGAQALRDKIRLAHAAESK